VTTFSVVICAYSDERWEELLAAVESVQMQSMPALETIVVVDRNPALLERARLIEQVTAVENTHTPGLGGARNSGLEVAQSSVVAFLDDDAVATTDWLEHFRRAYEDPKVLGAGGSIDIPGAPGLRFGMQVDNLLDVRTLYVYSPLLRAEQPVGVSDFLGFALPGRTVWVTLRWQAR